MKEIQKVEDKISAKMRLMRARVDQGKALAYYFYNQPVEELRGGTRVRTRGREMLMFASYSYLGLIGHPRINAAARAAIDKYGTGTHGVRTLAGSLDLHVALEAAIADFKHTEAAI